MSSQGRPPARSTLGGVLLVVVVALAGVSLYVCSAAHQQHDPRQALQQLDLLYLDEPAPSVGELSFPAGRPTLLVICKACAMPEVNAHIERSDEPRVARAFALQRADGSIGPGYAIVDGEGRVRYRTFDPGLAEHEQEIEILLDGVR